MMTAQSFSLTPAGPFDLANQNAHFGGWLAHGDEPGALVMSFPVDGAWDRSAAVVVRQTATGEITGEVYGLSDEGSRERAWNQAMAALSLDADGSGWPAAGERDPFLGRLQAQHAFLRPVLFHSAYEAGASFLLGHRLSVQQARGLRTRLAVAHGRAVEVNGQIVHAFPEPGALLQIEGFPGVTEQKIERLHGLAAAVQDGRLDRERLRSLGVEAALADVRSLPGVGPFFAQGIVCRGAGVQDWVTDDDISRRAMVRGYGLAPAASRADVLALAQTWAPYRMWATVLLHVWIRGLGDVPPRPAGRSRPGQMRVKE